MLDMSSHTENKKESVWAGSQMCMVTQRQEHPPPHTHKPLYRVVSLEFLWGRVPWRVCSDSFLGCTLRGWIQQF